MSIRRELEENRAVYRLLTGRGGAGEERSPRPPLPESRERRADPAGWTEFWNVPAPEREERPEWPETPIRPETREDGMGMKLPGEARREAGPVYSLGRIGNAPEPGGERPVAAIAEMEFPAAQAPAGIGIAENDLLEALSDQMERRQRLYPQELAGEGE